MFHCPICNQKRSYGRRIVHLCDNEIIFHRRVFDSSSYEYQWNCYQNMRNIGTKDKTFIKPLILFEKNFVTTLYE
ncbi:MAG: hypothetical protein ACFFFB_06135 [Candidatus Heimdallarchaeota archaeon]